MEDEVRSNPAAAIGLILTLALAACGEAPPPTAEPGSSVRDSAGVQVVESAAPVWNEGSGWHLGEAPLLDIGRLDGPDETQFFQVSSGARLSDGSFVLGSFGSHDLRRFTADGEHLWTVGREGEGPGEFAGLTQLVAGPGDTLLTYDFRQRRISRFAPDGTFVDARPLEGGGENGFAFVEALLPDGRSVYTWRVFGGAADGPPPEGEIRRDTIGIHVSGLPGDSVHELGRFPGPEMVVLHSGETEGGFNITISSPAFGRSTEVAAGNASVWIGDTDRFEVRRYGFDGTLEAIVRRTYDPVVVDDALVEMAMEEDLAEADDDNERRMIRRRWEDIPLPSTLPAYETLHIDRTGHLWVERFEVPGAHERIWSVFADDGAWLGDVTFPDRFSPLEIGDDYVLGRFGDELDVEHIQIWELVKPAS
jgi:hypothetical protein